MHLIKVDNILKGLAEADHYFQRPGIACWEKKQGKISIYLFSVIFATGEELLADYKSARDHIAVTFQSQSMVSSAERWNLYVFYLVPAPVSNETKLLIEQDKFSTRKIVCPNMPSDMTDEIIAARINAELFDFKIGKREVSTTTLNDMLNADFPLVANALEKLGSSDTVDALQPLLNLLGHE